MSDVDDRPTSDELRRFMRQLYVRGDLGTLEKIYSDYRESLDTAPWRGIVRRELELAIERLNRARRPTWKVVLDSFVKCLTRR